MQDTPDETLLTETGKGSERHLEALVARFQPMLIGVALRVLKCEADAKDLIQDVWLEVWRCARNYSPEKGKASTWLATLVHRRAIDRYKANSRRGEIVENYATSSVRDIHNEADSSPAEIVERAEAVASARRRVEEMERDMCLTPKQKEVFRACFVHGMSQGEAAKALGKTIPAIKEVRDYVSRALKGLLGRRITPGHRARAVKRHPEPSPAPEPDPMPTVRPQATEDERVALRFCIGVEREFLPVDGPISGYTEAYTPVIAAPGGRIIAGRYYPD